MPAGTVGLVFGDPAEISSYLIPHPIIRKVTFTGSTPVGKQLAAMAGAHMKRVTMELGGHAPVIVAEDADVDRAVKAAGGAKFRNAGQVCISPTRFLVHNSIREDFAKALVKHAESLKLGDGLAEGTTLGPLANPRRLTAMAKVMDDARAKGAKVVTGGERIGRDGNFFAPTVLTDVSLDADVFNNEPFGPVAAIRGFDTLDEAIAEANRLPYRPGRLRLHAVDQERAPAGAAGRGRHVVDQPAGHAVAGDALRRRQGLGLRVRGRARGDGGLSGHQGGVDPGALIARWPGATARCRQS